MRRFEVIGSIGKIQVIAIGGSIRSLRQLQRRFGSGRWRKMKGVGTIEYVDGEIHKAELHWYEAHGIGKVWMKVKRHVD